MRCGQILSLSLRGRQLHANKSCEIGAKIIQAEERQEGSQSQAFQPIFSTTHDLEEKEAPRPPFMPVPKSPSINSWRSIPHLHSFLFLVQRSSRPLQGSLLLPRDV